MPSQMNLQEVNQRGTEGKLPVPGKISVSKKKETPNRHDCFLTTTQKRSAVTVDQMAGHCLFSLTQLQNYKKEKTSYGWR